MKLITLTASVFVGLSISSHAVIATIGNNNFAVAFTDNAGVPLAAGSGVVAAGIFSDPSDIELVNLASDFTGLTDPNNAADSTFSVNAPNGQDGVLSGSIDGGRQAADSAFVGANIFFVIGNGSTLADSTEFAVFDTGFQFAADDTTPAPSSFAFVPSADTLVIGEVGADVGLFGGAVQATNFQLATAIPEPSSALLAGLALVGGLVRRRR